MAHNTECYFLVIQLARGKKKESDHSKIDICLSDKDVVKGILK